MGSTGEASPVLETERLLLRAPTPEDDAFFLELLNDPDWLRFIGDRQVRTLEDARGYVARLLETRAGIGAGLDVVVLREERVPIGISGLVRRDWLEHPDLGFAFLPRYRGRGYAREAALASLRDARERLHLERLYAIVSPANRSSVQLLEALGFALLRAGLPPGDADEVAVYLLHPL